MINPLPEELQWPPAAATRTAIGPFYGAMSSYTVNLLSQQYQGLLVVVTQDSQAAQLLERELSFFSKSQVLNILSFPDWETLPYDSFSPHQDIISERLQTLFNLPQTNRGVLITPISTLMHRLPPVDFVTGSSLILDIGQQLNVSQFRRQLESNGYHSVETVMERGEFAVRGSILDIYPMGSQWPYRVDLMDEDIDTLRTFDPETQRTLEQVNNIRLLPAREFALHKAAIEQFKQGWHGAFDVDHKACPTYTDISAGRIPNGAEYYLPLFFEKCATLFDYLPKQTTVITLGDHFTAAEHFWADVNNRYTEYGVDSRRPFLPPTVPFVPVEELYQHLKQMSVLEFRLNQESPTHFTLKYPPPPELIPEKTYDSPAIKISHYISEHEGRILICAESAGRREVLLEQLEKEQLKPEYFNDWDEFIESESHLGITSAPLDRGLIFNDEQPSLISESQLYGQRVAQRRRRKTTQAANDNVVKSLSELSHGSPVVHIEHGVGRYLGLQSLDIDDQTTEFLVLEYHSSAKLYVPVSSLHLISRYSGSEPELAPLHKLGSDHWNKAKRKAIKKAQDVAVELLEIYARRAAKKGFKFDNPGEAYCSFSSAFPFEETADQEQAIEQVFDDLNSEKAMDRLICGDVGFGKTEVAMRAAFVAVHSGKQVAILVPTTLLAQQHYTSFSDRFADWPVNVEVISRFKTGREQQTVINKLGSGKIDIIIGTHKLLQGNIKYHSLGLLIIDEEHRFGVKQKEKLKALRADIDILTLTATPIPRTLNMSMSGMRDLSIIATPPARRLSIKTFVREHNIALIKEAILRETLRGGQVYFLHNEVKTIEETGRKLRELLPDINIGIAHGQLRENQLEQVMSDFYHQKFHVLLCSTIIETGIDVPNANTIIIERADKFGLAQLHQLRGRVGRSHHQAYAYLLCPPRSLLTRDAEKRLEAIEQSSDLGAGYLLATHDLEIRGAGELLGEDQSGQIHSVGFSLYMEMLERAVESLKNGEIPDLEHSLTMATEVNLRVPALIPGHYLPDINTRLILYKRISAVNSDQDLRELQVEMIDRFGLLTNEIKNLFRTTQLKILAAKSGINKIEAGENGGVFEFDEKTSVNPLELVKLVQTKSDNFKLAGASTLRFTESLSDHEQRFLFVENLLNTLTLTTKNHAS
jgi:transcription-repair coupling factor (superfamily II helicase)